MLASMKAPTEYRKVELKLFLIATQLLGQENTKSNWQNLMDKEHLEMSPADRRYITHLTDNWRPSELLASLREDLAVAGAIKALRKRQLDEDNEEEEGHAGI